MPIDGFSDRGVFVSLSRSSKDMQSWIQAAFGNIAQRRESDAIKASKVVVIQSLWRGWKTRKYTRSVMRSIKYSDDELLYLFEDSEQVADLEQYLSSVAELDVNWPSKDVPMVYGDHKRPKSGKLGQNLHSRERVGSSNSNVGSSVSNSNDLFVQDSDDGSRSLNDGAELDELHHKAIVDSSQISRYLYRHINLKKKKLYFVINYLWLFDDIYF
jgi:hypothetical protein